MHSFEHDGKTMIRFIAFSPDPVKGYFRLNDIFQIFSLPDDAPQPGMDWADHPFIIEYSFDNPDVDALREIRMTGLSASSDTPPDHFLKSKLNWSKQEEILSVLSVITRYLIKKDKVGHCWVHHRDGQGLSERYAQTGYYWEGLSKLGEWFSKPGLPEIALTDSRTYYNQLGVTGDPLDLPNEIILLLDRYFMLDEDEKEAFLSACTLFSQSLEAWSVSHSLTYMGIVSSLEALIEFEYREAEKRNCSECGQPVYKVRQKFLEFIATYGSSSSEFRKFADNLYARRSGIGHRGELLSGDVVGQVMTPRDESRDFMDLLYLSNVARTCLVNWLRSRDQTSTVGATKDTG
jgi:hypothetical protein